MPPGFVPPVPWLVPIEPMPVALFMLFGPLEAEGEPAEFCMPAPLFMPIGELPPVVVAWDGFACMAAEPGEDADPELELPAFAEPGPDEGAPAPMVWAKAGVASARTALAIRAVFMWVFL